MTTATYEFNTHTSTKALDVNVPQRAGRALWAPAFAMSLIGFIAGMTLAIVKAVAIADGDAVLAASLNNYGIAAMFFGFTMVFTGISFAIARILGEFRVGGGNTQEAAGSEVKTLKMPATAKAFTVLMAMSMMILLAAVIAHVVVGVQIVGLGVAALTRKVVESVALQRFTGVARLAQLTAEGRAATAGIYAGIIAGHRTSIAGAVPGAAGAT